MKRYIAILRGINVGAHKRMKMVELKTSLEKDNLSDIKTYIQSGNVLFSSTLKDVSELKTIITERIKQDFSYDVPVIIIDRDSLLDIIESDPFHAVAVEEKHFTFISEIEEKHIDHKFHTLYNDTLYYHTDGVYLNIKEKYHKSKLSNNYFEKKHSSTSTTRNWKTMLKLCEMIQN